MGRFARKWMVPRFLSPLHSIRMRFLTSRRGLKSTTRFSSPTIRWTTATFPTANLWHVLGEARPPVLGMRRWVGSQSEKVFRGRWHARDLAAIALLLFRHNVASLRQPRPSAWVTV